MIQPERGIHGLAQRIDRIGSEKPAQHAGAALDEKPFDPLLLEFRNQHGGGYRPVGPDDGGDGLQCGKRPGGKNDLPAAAFGEETRTGIEVARHGEGDLRRLGRQPAGDAAGAGLRVAEGERGVVAPHGFGSDQDGVVFGAEALHLPQIFGRRDDQTAIGRVVEVAVGRRGYGCEQFHRRRVISVISGRAAPSRIGKPTQPIPSFIYKYLPRSS